MTQLLHDIAPLTFMCGRDGKDRNALLECKACSIASRWRFSPDRQAAPAMTDLGENTVELDAVAVADALAEITNKRREYRQRVLKGTTIIKGLGNSEIGCQVRKEHTGGAALRSPPENRAFRRNSLLYVPRDGLGVQFTGSGPKPRQHHG